MVQQAGAGRSAPGITKVHAVLGGFHLAPYKEDYVREVIANLKEINPDYVVPMHCTAEPFWEIARIEMPNKVLRPYTGTRFVFTHDLARPRGPRFN
jgi:7,8-dihydropterin-6-yl-methyl-4-(beta-D-ribofuranosyl)aminobenzene 5'-phosphate synthase